MPTCPKCGARTREGMNFCPNCGASLQVVEAAPTPPTPRTEAPPTAPSAPAPAAPTYRGEKEEKGEKQEKNQRDEKHEKMEEEQRHEKREYDFMGPLIGGLFLMFVGFILYLVVTGSASIELAGALFFIILGIVVIIGAIYAATMASRRHPQT